MRVEEMMMVDYGKVSVIVTVYNQEKYLDRSVPSILGQTYKNLEVLLVNDGSTDKSSEILAKYASMDSRVQIITKKNGGLVDASISGVKSATGEFVVFVDADDYIGEKFVETLVERIDECDFVAAGIYYDNNGQHTPVLLEEDREFKGEDISWLRTHYLLREDSSYLSTVLYQSRCNKMYRLSCLLKMIDSFAEYKEITLGEDTVFTYLMLSVAESGKTLREPNSYYYNTGNQNSMMKDANIENHLNKTKAIYKRYTKLMKKNGELNEQPLMVYFMFIESLMARAEDEGFRSFERVHRIVKKDKTYKKSLEMLISRESNKKRKAILLAKRYITISYVYRTLVRSARVLMK